MDPSSSFDPSSASDVQQHQQQQQQREEMEQRKHALLRSILTPDASARLSTVGKLQFDLICVADMFDREQQFNITQCGIANSIAKHQSLTSRSHIHNATFDCCLLKHLPQQPLWNPSKPILSLNNCYQQHNRVVYKRKWVKIDWRVCWMHWIYNKQKQRKSRFRGKSLLAVMTLMRIIVICRIVLIFLRS